MSDNKQQTTDVQKQEAGERRGRNTFGQKGGDRRKRGPKRGPRKDESGSWVPTTKLGRLVKEGKVKDIRDIFVHSIPVKEHQIIDHFLGSKLSDEVMRISPVQKQTTAGQRTRFKAVVVVGDSVQHCGLGIKVASEVATAIRGAIILAKLSIVPTRKGYWGNKIGEPHTVPCKLTGKCGSVRVRLVPAPRGSGLVASPVPKKLLSLGGYSDVFTSSVGNTKTLANFVSATFAAIKKTYNFKTPDLWTVNPQLVSPFAEHSKFLSEKKVKKEYPKRERRERR
ncbi:ribosomal protein S5 [Naegleria gruberi]|uniref:Small ribosomal subunit protein uS5 n=1 Tax=Naegleria gruberi TaxID=5762 RepID=D2UXJ7_NAEGR|nr:ribosomal protein S5 [Naegleria gruberi]EFC50645.1 ribosomal protein S5 [Naegleria gruberi]|eukprot:XP_002683389.1 ribosomal protein S5 [Naegleria gruberi strain NEG-M]